jgi:NSS family neurotransmitter:Na+ symporter
VICLVACIIGLLFCTKAGLYWLDIVDHWINNYGLAAIGLAEVIVIGFVFGARPFRKFINSVSEVKVGVWWDIMIMVVTPIILGATIVLSFYKEFSKPYEGYPQWALNAGGWAVVVGVLVLSFILIAIKRRKGGKRR